MNQSLHVTFKCFTVYFMCCKLIHTTVFTYSGKVGAENSKGLQHEYTRG